MMTREFSLSARLKVRRDGRRVLPLPPRATLPFGPGIPSSIAFCTGVKRFSYDREAFDLRRKLLLAVCVDA